MTNQPEVHPPSEQLTAFALGLSEPGVSEGIGAHLAECAECRQTVKDVPHDTFVSMVRECGTMVNGPSEPEEGRKNVAEPVTMGSADSATPPDAVTDAATVAPSGGGAASTMRLDPGLADHPRYHIVQLLGSGGMGSVYKAEHRLMRRSVALKVINAELVSSKSAVERFQREVQAAARLQHPNIVTAHDAEQAGDSHFLVMEYVKGTDLHKVLEERGPLPMSQACDYVRQAALGLQHAHESGMVHRDIKPQNLMLTEAGQIKILDFGLASLVSDAVAPEGDAPATLDSQKPGLTQAGAIMGTPDYMAPEQAKDAHSADIRADIYSLGCTLYALLTGKAPHPGGTAMDKIIAHSERTPQPVSAVRDDVPQGLLDVLDRMMAKAPAQRQQTPAEVAQTLTPFCDPNAAESKTRKKSRRPWLTLAASAAAILLLAAGIVFFLRTPSGTMRIEINDPNVKVGFAGKSYTFENKGETISITPGEHALRVERGDLKFETKKFTLGRGDNPLRVDFLEGQLTVKVGDTVIGQETEGQWVQLFNGKDLSGWKTYPGQPGLWTVDKGVLVASGPQSHLFTNRGDFGDFHLRATVKISKGGDSGIFFRTGFSLKSVGSGFVVPDGYEAQIVDGSSNPLKTGSLLGSKHHALAAHDPIGPDQWFDLEIIAKGNRIITRVNGTTIVDHVDIGRSHSRGHLALQQVKPGTTVHFSNIEIKELLPQEPTWVQLFNGKDLTGWKADDPKRWKVVDKLLVGEHPLGGQHSHLVSERNDFENFHLRMEAKFCAGGSTVVTCGAAFEAPQGWSGFRVAAGERHVMLTRPDEYGLKQEELVRRLGDSKRWIKDRPIAADRWFTLEIIANGPNIRVLLDGDQVIGYVEPEPERYRTKGNLLLQVNPLNPEFTIRKIEIKELPAEHAWVPLFNGKNLANWKPHPNWRVEGGVLVASGPLDKAKGASLGTERSDFADFHLRVEARVLSPLSDSGVFVRIGNKSWCEANICCDPKNKDKHTGSIHIQKVENKPFPGWITAPPDLTKPNEWMMLEIIARGQHVITKVNGKTTAEIRNAEINSQGPILLQQYGEQTVVQFKKVEIREFPSTEPEHNGEVRRFAGHTEAVISVAISADGSRALSGSHDGTVRLWDTADGKELLKLDAAAGPCEAVALSPDGTHALGGYEDGVTRLWNLKTGKIDRSFEKHDGQVRVVAFTPDGKRALSAGGGERSVRVWNVATGEQVHCLKGHKEFLTQLVVSSDGRRALSGGFLPDSETATVRLWDLVEGKEATTFEAPWCCGFAFLGDGQQALMAAQNSKGDALQLWDLSTSKPVRDFRFRGHGVMQMAVSGDHRLAVTCGMDKSVRVWDVESLKQLKVLKGHGSTVYSVAVSASGRYAVSGGGDTKQMQQSDNSVRLWRLPEIGQPATPTRRPTATDEIAPKHRQAIDKALAYLVKAQHADGHWEAANGQFPVAMTALAGMALLMEGSTTRDGKHAEPIRKAVDWLMVQSQPDGRLVDKKESRYMFGHGYSLLFLASAYEQEEDVERRRALKGILTRAVQFTAAARTTRGGWGYVSAAEGNDFDECATTIPQMQGVRAARNAGIAVPRELLDAEYLRLFTGKGGGVLYSLTGAPSERPALAAAALASCEYDSEFTKKWLRFCQEKIPLGGARIGWDEFMHYYYAQAVYSLGEKGYAKLFPGAPAAEHLTWSKYRAAMFDQIVARQAADGSIRSQDGVDIGPVYPTAVWATVLQLDDGVLPIYQRSAAGKANRKAD